MKKVLILAFSAVLMASCNSGSEHAETVKDSTVQAIDSTGAARVDSVEAATDSLKTKTENTFEKTDSANKVLVDSSAKAGKK
ncbi:hypothetical protein EPD60_04335 [Flaviaesturariibacter flavus]|uniref:Lipoprotein n=1 Tax=Flaviaesturariibacter flavus TaxID=2502780 RepID=A0A4R1BJ92_9BACT|nr:hypothetical protein [Flaviaesturariibacter flavus]TCJ17425.1 hypothetical protein EPD60_04335 [Flaviaesturariibacter flavus]